MTDIVLHKSPRFIKNFSTFLVIGSLTAFIYFSLLSLFIEMMRLNYRLAVTFAFIFACGFQFFANRKYTFKAIEKNAAKQLVRYLLWVILSYLITLGTVTLAHEVYKINAYLSVLIALIFTTNLGFLLSQRWIYKKDEK